MTVMVFTQALPLRRKISFIFSTQETSRWMEIMIISITEDSPALFMWRVPDGLHFGTKEVAVSCEDYPENYTCHIRDPKVWKEGEEYRMILGGRQKSDQGAVLFYRSEDLKNWKFDGELTTEKAFGYMWECPDFFTLEGQEVLSVSPRD